MLNAPDQISMRSSRITSQGHDTLKPSASASRLLVREEEESSVIKRGYLRKIWAVPLVQNISSFGGNVNLH